MTDPTITPASDEEIADYRKFHFADPHDWPVRLIARIEADRATIAKQAEENERLRAEQECEYAYTETCGYLERSVPCAACAARKEGER